MCVYIYIYIYIYTYGPSVEPEKGFSNIKLQFDKECITAA